MGIYDRDYYRGEGYSFLGSFTERGRACKWLIGINVVLFILQMVAQPRAPRAFDLDADDQSVVQHVQDPRRVNLVTDTLDLQADKVVHGQVWRLLTYAFLHSPGDFFHILFNMLFLWWFGTDVEDLYGSKEFLAIYLVSAFLGGVVYTLAWAAHLGSNLPCLGASGAVLAVTVLCAIHYPNRTILLFFFVPVPIWLLVIVSVAWDLYQFLSQVETGTAVSVHLAGAGFAFLYYKANWRLTPLWDALVGWRRRLFRPRLRVYREEPREPVPVSAPPSAGDVDEQLEAKLDAVLEKVARYGRQSLSESENQILLRASEIYKRRRT